MKIKEKGLKGKAAENRKEAMNNRGFNAFRLMGLGTKGASSSTDAEKEVLLDFLGHQIRIHKDESGNGTVKEEDVPFVRGATLRFDGCGGSLSWPEIKVTRSPF
jgi:lupus La protein